MSNSYRPKIKLRFVTEELGFESDEQAARFVCDYEGNDLLQTQDEEVFLETSLKSATLFEKARKEAFSKVDIKGQI